MCGIVGSIKYRGQVDIGVLTRQRDSLTHRGPDTSGLWFSDDMRVAFGHRRLAIIDLSAGGHQPMLDRATGNVITFNGEIYNFVELRNRLKDYGHTFSTGSDTEVILAAYREWGVGCPEYLDGMFAFAIFDSSKNYVFVARDRAGEKPLYYFENHEGLSFASEIKGLITDPSIPRRVRRQSLNEYLAYGYTAAENTMFSGIKRLPPACRAICSLDTHILTITKYWQLPEFPRSRQSPLHPRVNRPTTAELTQRLHDLLRESVRRQLISDVPIGVLLSGGVDSSLIAAVAAEVHHEPIRTFTVRFQDDAQFDEGPFARLVANHLKTKHTELMATPPDAQQLLSIVRQFDDPISDSSMIPTFLVSREIRAHATVALGGDGGDELFGGYRRYPFQILQDSIRQKIPRFLGSRIASFVASTVSPSRTGRAFAIGLFGERNVGISYAGRCFRGDERRQLSDALASYSEHELLTPERYRQTEAGTIGSALQRSTALDFGNYMVDDVLAKVDKASMLSSLEVRAPFLDRSIIEFAFGSLPDHLRATINNRKVILRMLGQRLLPSTLDTRRKQGFSVPIDSWMKGAWHPLLVDAKSWNGLLVKGEALSRYTSKLKAGQPVGERLYALLFLTMWEHEFQITDIVE